MVSVVSSVFAALCCFVLSVGLVCIASAGVLDLEFRPHRSGSALAKGGTFPGGSNGDLTLARLDFLISGLSLQKTDGTWVESSPD
ncbi:MAG: hypothetical protein ACRCXD_09505, partial [Luteolibacter sp.]